MAVGDVLAPAVGMFSGTLAKAAKYWWVLFIFVGIFVAIAIVFFIKMMKAKKEQWSHTLVVRRVLANNLLSKPIIHKMRRFPMIKKAEVFELEKPLLGGFLIPELEQYSDVNEFSIILDNNNRIYTNKGEFFSPEKGSTLVSAKHSEIDIQRSNLKADFQNINKVNKRVEWATIAKYAFMAVAILAIMIVSIIGIQNWGEAHQASVVQAGAEAEAMKSLARAMETVQATVNTQNIMIPKLIELTGTNNIQAAVNNENT